MPACSKCGFEAEGAFKFCPECGAEQAAAAPHREQRKIVTVLFCDLTGSTALGETLDPERLRALLARYFERMEAIVERHGGSVEKFIGDAVMAVFGVPALHEDDALRAVRAAAEMRDALPELGLKGRIGVMTGEVVTGTEERLATGDAVNVAARLEQAAQPGDVLVGQPTLALVRDAADVEPIEPLELKGKSEPVPAYRLLRVHDAPERRHGELFVGRERELATLQEVWERVQAEQRCELVTVAGDAGVGKSRLAAELLASIEATVLRGRCLPYGEGITYWPVVEVLKQVHVLPPEEAAAAAIRSLLGETEAATSAEEIAWAFRKTLERTAAERPLVVVFDDIQWGEEIFLDLIEHVALLSSGASILLFCIARPELIERRPAWPVAIRLEPLGDEDVDELIPERIPGELRDKIARASGGNPLFIEEMLGIAGEADGDVIVPPTLQALLAARLDQLETAERSVLERGAIEGEIFHRGAVQALAPEDTQVTPRLAALVRKELIRPDTPQLAGEDGFRFRHLLIRDAAYDALPKATRADLHERFASWLEEHGTELVELDEILGYHLEQASAYRTQLAPADERSDAIGRRAAARLATAGRRASGRGDFPAAANLLRRALRVGPPAGAERAATLYHLADALAETDDARAAFVAFDEAARFAAVSGDRSLEWLARIGRSEAQTEADPHSLTTKDFREELEEAIRGFEELGNEAGLAAAWRKLAFLEFMPCRFDRAERAAHRAVAHARACDDDRLLFESLRTLLFSQAYGSTTPEEGYRTLDGLVEDVSRSRPIEASALAVRGAFEAMEGSFDEARRHAGLAIQIEEALGARVMAAVYEAFLGDVEIEAGDAIAAEQAFRRNYEIFDEMGHEGFRSTAAANLAGILCELGRFDEAEGFAAIARSVAAEDDLSSQVFGRSAQAAVLAARGESDEAERLAREAVQMLGDAESPGAQGAVRMDLARVLRLAGKPADAEYAAREALAFFERKGNRPSSDATRAFIAELVPPGRG